jgi:hypothetical protein
VAVTAIPKLEHFFRLAAELDIDKSDVRRFNEFLNKKLTDLLIRGQATAKQNVRDIVMPSDLPITNGLRQCMYAFREFDKQLQLEPVLAEIIDIPQLDFEYAVETEQYLPQVAGGLSVALARSFPLIDTNVKNPQTWQWERAFRLFDLLI